MTIAFPAGRVEIIGLNAGFFFLILFSALLWPSSTETDSTGKNRSDVSIN